MMRTYTGHLDLADIEGEVDRWSTVLTAILDANIVDVTMTLEPESQTVRTVMDGSPAEIEQAFAIYKRALLGVGKVAVG